MASNGLYGRVLYIWAIRHPGSGYVQGINDLLTPFFVVFLTPYVDDITSCNLAELPPGVVQVVDTLIPVRMLERVAGAGSGGRRILVSHQATRRYPGSLHFCSAWNTANGF